VIATCGYDKKINIWKEVKMQVWDRVYQFEAGASVNSIAWAPWEYGLILAAGSADGKIHIIQRKQDDTWTIMSFEAHDGGVNAVSWGPPTDPSMLSQEHVSA
jgi:protein transport protein SEC13